MPNDNQPAKSYIETVLARADADLVVRTDAPGGDWGFTRAFFVVDKATGAELGEFRGGVISCFAGAETTAKNNAARDAAEVCAERINAATTLAKMLLRAIEALEKHARQRNVDECRAHAIGEGHMEPTGSDDAAGDFVDAYNTLVEESRDALADINALAAKGSQ